MSDTVQIKFVVQQLDHPVEEHVFEQDMITVGKGRPGKEKKGVDLQLKDPDVARVHCAIHVRSADDIFVMPMGTAATYVGGTKVKLKEKLTSGSLIEMGTSQITVYVGADAVHAHLTPAAVPANTAWGVAAGSTQDDLVVSSREEVAIQSGEYEVMPSYGGMQQDVSHPQHDPQHNYAGISSHVSGSSVHTSAPSVASATVHAQNSPNRQQIGEAAVQNQGYALYPMHAEPEGVFGPMGPPPSPLPSQFPPHSLPMLLDVADRLGKEIWFVEDKIL